MDINLIEKLMKDMDESSLTKLSIECDGFKISMEKEVTSTAVRQSECVEEPVQMSAPPAATAEAERPAHTHEVEHHSYITSPMVGTFYAAAGPDKAPYIKVGDHVKCGQTACIIESMKLMNEIESDVEGEVTAVLVADGDMVEYGQKIFEVCPR